MAQASVFSDLAHSPPSYAITQYHCCGLLSYAGGQLDMQPIRPSRETSGFTGAILRLTVLDLSPGALRLLQQPDDPLSV
jgi:hypothetical protein